MSNLSSTLKPVSSSLPGTEGSTCQPDRLMTLFPFSYAWIILIVGTLGRILTMPGQTLGVSGFLDPIITGLQLERSTVSLMYAIGTLIASISLPFIGRFVDRKGPHLSVVLIAASFAGACLWMGFVQGSVTLMIGFILLRGLGQGALTLVSLQVINLWFVKQRGFAIGVASLGFALGGAAFPVLIERMVNGFGWRISYMLLGLMIALTVLPLGALFFRNRPELYGLKPDIAPKTDTTKANLPAPDEVNLTLAEARRTVAFWLFSLGDFVIVGFGTALVFHHYSIVAEQGMGREIAAFLFVPLGMVTAGSNFVTGLAMDRIQPRFLVSTMMLFMCGTLLMATQVSSFPLLVVYSCMLGITMGMRGVIDGGIYADYFGRLYSGSIKGFASTLSIAGSAFGPIVLAFGLERFGSYTPVLILSSISTVLFAGMALMTKPPKQKMNADPA